MEARISGIKDTTEEMDTLVKGNVKKILAQNIQEIWDTMKRTNLRIIRIEEGKETQIKDIKYFQQNHKRKFPNLKKETRTNV